MFCYSDCEAAETDSQCIDCEERSFDAAMEAEYAGDGVFAASH